MISELRQIGVPISLTEKSDAIPSLRHPPRSAWPNARGMIAPDGSSLVPGTKPGGHAASQADGRATAGSPVRPLERKGGATAGSSVRPLDRHFAGYFASRPTKVCGISQLELRHPTSVQPEAVGPRGSAVRRLTESA
jgi:hypothetical protein